VTVAVPACNGARFIREALESVLAQTFRDFELVVIDDCSDDETTAIVSRIRDPRLRLEVNPFRRGLVGNWNRCLSAADSEYVAIFHQDDVMVSDNLARKIALLDAYPAVAFVHSNVRQIGSAGEVLSDGWYAPPSHGDEGVHQGRVFLERLFNGENVVCCPAVVLRREMVTRHGLFDAHLPFTADWEMWMRLCLFHDVAYLADHLVYYRRHPSAETERFRGVAGIEQCFMAKHRILEKYGEHLQVDEWRQRLFDQYAAEATRRVRAAMRDGRLDEVKELLLLMRRLRDDSGGDEQADVDWITALMADAVRHSSQPLAERIETQNIEMSALRARASESDATARALYASYSWRLTAPLRLIFRLLTGRSA
jgi:hypothetical protein